MAIRIICTQCERQISIDSAFAGGICRCPYCKALVKVKKITKDGDDFEQPVRPDAPPSRYDSQAETPSSARPAVESRPVAPQNLNILDAKPVLFQGISGFVLLSLSLAALLGAIALYVGLKPAESPEQAANRRQQTAAKQIENLPGQPATEPSAVAVAVVERPATTMAVKPAGQTIVKPPEKPIAVVESPATKPDAPAEMIVAVDEQARSRVERPFARANNRPGVGTEEPASKPVAPVIAESQPATQPQTPTATDVPATAPPVLDITIHEPVIFCVDASAAFRPAAYSYAEKIILHYINGLQDQDKYNVILAGNGGNRWLNAIAYPVRGNSKPPTSDFFSSMPPAEQFELDKAMAAVWSQQPTPATVVIFSNKNPSADALRHIKRQKTSKTTIICLVLDATEGSAPGLDSLASNSGWQVNYYTLARLDELVGKFKDKDKDKE